MVISAVAEEVEGPLNVRGNMDATVAEYRAAVAQALQTQPENTHILLEKYSRYLLRKLLPKTRLN